MKTDIFILVLGMLTSKTHGKQSNVLKVDEIYILPAPGDGDQRFLGEDQLLLLTTSEWFHGKIGEEEAFLFTVIGGKHDGKIIALTSRVTTGLADNLANFGLCSVVVHFIHHPNKTFSGKYSDTLPIGMTILARYEDSHIWDAK